MQRGSKDMTRSKWFLPVFSVVLGAIVLAANWIGGNLVLGLESLGLMTAFGMVVLLAGRSQTVRGLRGDGRDERFTMIDLRATAMAGQVMIAAVIIAWLVEVAQGRSGSPYYWLAAIGGAGYLVAIVIQRLRG